MSTGDQSRSEFEAWILTRSAHTGLARYVTKPSDYKVSGVQLAWESWQAARGAALREAAETCEEVDPVIYRHGGDTHDDAAGTRRACIDAIRALAAKTQEGQEQ